MNNEQNKLVEDYNATISKPNSNKKIVSFCSEKITSLKEFQKGHYTDKNFDISSIFNEIINEINLCVVVDKKNQHYFRQANASKIKMQADADTSKIMIHELTKRIESERWLNVERWLKEEERVLYHRIFYYIGMLNFIIKNYKQSIISLNKATDLEEKENFQKKLLLAYSFEYTDQPMEAIKVLIGRNPIDGVLEKAFRNQSIDYEVQLLLNETTEIKKDKYDSIIEKISAKDEGLYSLIKNHNDKDKYTKEIAYLVSHCLSEYCLIGEKKEIDKGNIEFQFNYLRRLSERIMDSLGDDYITYSSILYAEHGDYISAIKRMQEWKTSQLKLYRETLNKDDQAKKNMFEASFLIWHFSLMSGYVKSEEMNDAEKIYKDYWENTKDYPAECYYHLISFRFVLRQAFKNLFSELDDAELDDAELDDAELDDAELDDAEVKYNQFSKCEPMSQEPIELHREWNKLEQIYELYKCAKSFKKGNLKFDKLFKCTLKCHFFRKPEYEPEVYFEDKDSFYIIDFGNRKLLYIGDIEKLKNYLDLFNIRYEIKCFIFNNEEETTRNKLDMKLKETLTILVDLSEASKSNGFVLIDYIISEENKHQPNAEEYHNIIINNEINFELKYPDNTILTNIISTNNFSSFVKYAYVFSTIEGCIDNLNYPMDLFIVTPFPTSVAYSLQNLGMLHMMTYVKKSEENSNYSLEYKEWADFSVRIYRKIIKTKIKAKRSYIICNDLFKEVKNIIYFDLNGKFMYNFCIDGQNKGKVTADGLKITYSTIYLKRLLRHIVTHDKKTKRYHVKCHQNSELPVCRTCFPNKSGTSFDIFIKILCAFLGINVENDILLFSKEEKSENWVIATYSKVDSVEAQIEICKYFSNNERNLIKEEEEENATEEDNEMADLIKQMDVCDSTKKYMFISYRAHGSNKDLCRPVFKDCIALQKKGINFWIDKKNAGVNFRDDIMNALNNENCIGAIVYLSKEYTDSTEHDKCLEELTRINNIKITKPNFIVKPVYLNNMENSMILDLLDKCSRGVDSIRREEFKKLCGVHVGLGDFAVICSTWEPEGKHLLKNTNFINDMSRKHNITWEQGE